MLKFSTDDPKLTTSVTSSMNNPNLLTLITHIKYNFYLFYLVFQVSVTNKLNFASNPTIYVLNVNTFNSI